MGETNGITTRIDEHTEISESYLSYKDDRVDYKVYIGNKIRRELIVLDDKPGIVTKKLEIDLSNGFVYYDIEPAVAGAVAYYYDTANRTVDNYEIRRLIFEIRNTKFAPSPEVKKVIEQLPCDNWKEVLSQLPGWQEIIEHRYDNLFLPYGEVQNLSVPDEELKDPDGTLKTEDGAVVGAWKDLKSVCIASGRSKISHQGWKHDFRIVEQNGKPALLYGNDNIGAEFFHEDEEYKRVFTDREYRWFLSQVQSLLSGLKQIDQEPKKRENKSYVIVHMKDKDAIFLADSQEKLLQINEKIMQFLKLELNITE